MKYRLFSRALFSPARKTTRSLRHQLSLLVGGPFHDIYLEPGSAGCQRSAHKNKQHLNVCKDGCAYRAYERKGFCRLLRAPWRKWVLGAVLGGSAGGPNSSWTGLFSLIRMNVRIHLFSWIGRGWSSAHRFLKECPEMQAKYCFWVVVFFFWGMNIVIHLKPQKADFAWYRSFKVKVEKPQIISSVAIFKWYLHWICFGFPPH